MPTSQNLFAVILAGGSGSRLWPLSRREGPKHLLNLKGEGTLLQQTAKRLFGMLAPEQVLVVTQREQAEEVTRQMLEIAAFPAANVLAEPRPRNTLPAVLWAARLIAARSPKAVVGVFPSDHLILNEEAFRRDFASAVEVARQGYLVTFGVRPTGPETGFGYIRAGEPLSEGAFRAAAFVEKPDRKTAEGLLAQKGYFWNSGIFAFDVSSFLSEVQRLAEPFWRSDVAEIYASLPPLSIDVGVLERSDKVALVPASFDWNDLGNWEAVYQVLEKDSDGNVLQGLVRAEDTHSSLLISRQGFLGAVGLRDIVVVRSGDSVLVCPRDRAQEVRTIADPLESAASAAVERPWGRYTVLEEGPRYKLKRIVVSPGQKLSLQRHRQRAEHWVVLEGTAKVTKDGQETLLQKNESTFIPIGQKHRLENPGREPLVIIEVQTGDYVGEDDIERFEDLYGRPTNF